MFGMPEMMKLWLNLLKLCLEYCRLWTVDTVC